MVKHLVVTLLLAAPLVAATPGAARAQRPAAELARERAELLRMHRADRDAHFRADADLLLADAPDEMIAVSDGKVRRSTKANSRRGFAEYFRGATYQEWDDVQEPIVRVSDDASMAWMITNIRVRRTQKDSTGVEREERFVYAGIMTYEKRAGRWVRVANVSTFEPKP